MVPSRATNSAMPRAIVTGGGAGRSTGATAPLRGRRAVGRPRPEAALPAEPSNRRSPIQGADLRRRADPDRAPRASLTRRSPNRLHEKKLILRIILIINAARRAEP